MKKYLAIFICLILLFSFCFTLSACNTKQLTIVYLGDSIAEAIIGPSPLSERDSYGYFGLVGRRNNYIYYNRAVSGHQSTQFLSFLKREDNGATMTRSLIKSADIIHVSILGNDLLQRDLGQLIVSVAKEDFTLIDTILAESRSNFAQIVSTIREYNPNAVLFFQNVYNPVFEGSTIIRSEARAELLTLGYEQNEYRALGDIMLSRLNAVISDYLTEHPGAFYLLDACAEFDRISKEDLVRGSHLIYNDWVHPSSEGHAVLADLTQRYLEELELAKKSTALDNYRDIKIDQLNRLFSSSVDIKAASKRIKACSSCEEVTKVYFETIAGKTPIYC